MKKFYLPILFLLLPALGFSETIFVPRLGFSMFNFKHNDAFSNKIVGWVNDGIERNKREGEVVEKIEEKNIPRSNPSFAAFNIGLDMQFIAKNGFTFFWNNEFVISSRFKASDRLHYNKKPAMSLESDYKRTSGSYDEKMRIMLIGSEFLFGATFLREKPFNFHFGVGLKFAGSPLFVPDVLNAIGGKFKKQRAAALYGGFGGTIGASYYFNDSVGVSISVSDFVGLGFFAAGKDMKIEGGRLKDGLIFGSLGLSQDFSMKLGVTFRLNGKHAKKAKTEQPSTTEEVPTAALPMTDEGVSETPTAEVAE